MISVNMMLDSLGNTTANSGSNEFVSVSIRCGVAIHIVYYPPDPYNFPLYLNCYRLFRSFHTRILAPEPTYSQQIYGRKKPQRELLSGLSLLVVIVGGYPYAAFLRRRRPIPRIPTIPITRSRSRVRGRPRFIHYLSPTPHLIEIAKVNTPMYRCLGRY